MALPSPVKIFGENFVHSGCAVTAGSGSGVQYLYDGKNGTVWKSAGSNDATSEVLGVSFANRAGIPVSVTFDRIILQNTNAASMSAAYVSAAGETVVLPEAALSGIIADSVIVELAAPVTARSLTLTFKTTQTANEEKYLGGLKVCASVMTFGNALCAFSRADYAKQGDYYLASGSLVHWREYRKAGGTLCVENLTQADRDKLNKAINTQEFLTVSFIDDIAPGEVYEFFVSSAPTEEFDRHTLRYTCEFQVKER